MADRLATPEDLASLLERDDIDASKAGILVEIATAVVQEAAGRQRIVQVVGDVLDVMGSTDAWLPLPQLPVASVSSVMLDGTTLTLGTDYSVYGNRLWRGQGWQTNWGWPIDWPLQIWGPNGSPYNWTGSLSRPSAVVVTYTHGYAAGSQELQLARGAVLSICVGAYGKTAAPHLKSESIDDYAVTFEALAGQMESSPYLKAALARKYGRRAGLVRLG